jgi:hypothetical protein
MEVSQVNKRVRSASRAKAGSDAAAAAASAERLRVFLEPSRRRSPARSQRAQGGRHRLHLGTPGGGLRLAPTAGATTSSSSSRRLGEFPGGRTRQPQPGSRTIDEVVPIKPGRHRELTEEDVLDFSSSAEPWLER